MFLYIFVVQAVQISLQSSIFLWHIFLQCNFISIQTHFENLYIYIEKSSHILIVAAFLLLI